MYLNWIHAKSNKMHFKIFKVDDIFNFLTNVWTVGNYLFIYCFKTFIHSTCMVFTKLY